jgi:hypothetical protein
MSLFLSYYSTLIQHNIPGREIEVIFDEIGFLKTDGHPGFSVSLQKWNKLLRKYELSTTEPVHSIDYINRDERKTVIENNTTYLRKTRVLHHISTNNYPFRINIKDEKTIEAPRSFNHDLIRDKTRYSYYFPDRSARLDLTKVVTTSLTSKKSKNFKPSNDTYVAYEVELEFLNDNNVSINTSSSTLNSYNNVRDSQSALQRFLVNIELVLKDVLETENIYTIGQRINLTTWFNNNFSTDHFKNANDFRRTPPGKLNEDLIVKARNLKLKDMKEGGLVGNKNTHYSITKKADGLQKILIIFEDGVWLCSSADINWIYRLETQNNSISELFGFVTIGELIPPSNRKTGAPDSKYWFLQFDSINWFPEYEDFQNNAKVVINKSTRSKFINRDRTQNLSRPDRHRICEIVNKRFSDNILTVGVKEFRPFWNVDQFYASVMYMSSDIEENLGISSNLFKSDGFVFTPELAPFNPGSDKYPLYQRTLSKHPDVCKWKPPEDLTIDFSIRRTIDGITKLYSGRPKNYFKSDQVAVGFGFAPHEYSKEFKGSSINPFNSETDLDLSGLENVPDGTTGEFEFDQKTQKLRLRLLREKYPNTYEVADNVWDDIHRPITLSTLRGESSALVRAYHNSIKRELFIFDSPNNLKTLIDIGAGRGASIHNYHNYSKVLAVEPNSDNIAELRNRLHTAGLSDKVTILKAGGENTELITATANALFGGQADTITMMLSLSFFFQTSTMLNNLTNTISENLKVGGNFLFLTIDGAVVSEIFEPSLLQRSPYIQEVEDGLFLSIKYIGEFTYQPGNQLLVNIFDSIVTNQTEWLVNLNDLQWALETVGIKKHSYKRAIYNNFLSPWEQMYTNMYSYGVYSRIKNAESLTNYSILSAITAESKREEPQNTELQILENKKNTDKNMSSSINFNSDRVVDFDDILEYEPNFSQIKSPRANLITTPRNINILPIRNTLVDIKIQDYSDEVLNSAQNNTINTIGRVKGIPIGGSSISLDTSIPITSSIVTNDNFKAVFSLLNDEAKELVSMNKLNKDFETSQNLESLSEQILPFAEVKKDADDDTLQPLFENIVKISTISGVDSFFHAFLKSFYPGYNEVSGIAYRNKLVREFRRELSTILTYADEKNPGFTYYDTLLKFTAETFPEYASKSIEEYKNLLLSDSSVNIDIMKFSSYVVNIDINLVLAYATDLRIIFNTGNTYPTVILYGKGDNFEPIGVIRDHLVQTVFKPNDPYLSTLSSNL